MSAFDISALFFALVAMIGVVNHHYVRLPHTIGLVVMSLMTCGVIKLVDGFTPDFHILGAIESVLRSIDFYSLVMHGMLGFLLFAGSLHVNVGDLKNQKWAIGSLATVGVLISTGLIGVGVWFGWGLAGIAVPLSVCLVFGALISPTDPIAVLGIMKTINVPKSLETKIAGESLFNDGTGVVVFTALLAFAAYELGMSHGVHATGPLDILVLFLREALGGAVLGAIFGYLAFLLIRSLDEHYLEIMVTIALVTGIMSVGKALHVSGVVGVVVAGLYIGNRGTRLAMSDHTRQHLLSFWSVLDEILNSVLFLLLGLEFLIIQITNDYVLAAAIALPVVILARFTAVGIPMGTLKVAGTRFSKRAVRVMTWGGLRGAISLALVLSLPHGPYKDLLVSATYMIVIFSIIVQGLTIKRLIATEEGVDLDGSETAQAAAH